MKWTTKAAIQRLLSTIPYGSRAYYLGQKRVGGFRNFTIDSKLHQGERVLACLWSSGDDLCGDRAIEIGTGWVPTIPLLFWLYGQGECFTYDITRLLKEELLLKAVDQFLRKRDLLEGKERKPDFSRFEQLAMYKSSNLTAAEIMQKCQLNYHAPVDAANSPHPHDSIDLIYSNTVLEHVDPQSVHRLFQKAYNILKPDGKMLHLIDMSDHFSHRDPSITSVNFLQFSEEEFRRYNSKFLYQNRWRASTWRQIFEQHGFEIVAWQANVNEKAKKALPSLRLDKHFANLDEEDICISSVCVLARKP